MKTWQIVVFSGILASGCGFNTAKSHYGLAEKLWMEKKYSAAVSEFEKVISKDPSSALAKQALYRAASTQYLFLSQYNEAIRKFQAYIQTASDPQAKWNAKVQVGEILYSKLENYDQAITHYKSILAEKPDAMEASEILFRIGKSQYYLLQFNEAIASFEAVQKKYPKTPWAEKAAFEIGATYLAQGQRYQQAIASFRKFIATYPKSQYVPEAHFGIASCMEELNQLKEAFQAFVALKATYPAPQVIEVKLARIQQRMAQKNVQ